MDGRLGVGGRMIGRVGWQAGGHWGGIEMGITAAPEAEPGKTSSSFFVRLPR